MKKGRGKEEMEETKERLKILKEIREDRRKVLERLEGVDINDIRVWVLLKELTYLEREIMQLSWEILKLGD